MLLNKVITSTIAILVFSLLVNAAIAGEIMIKDAWVREAPPNAKVLAAYMTIENHTSKEIVLTSATSPAFAKIEIHKTVHKGDMATMEEQKELPIGTHKVIKLEPGGLHLMLYNPNKPLKAGDSVSFTLKYADGSTSSVDAKVKKATGSSGHHHHSEHSGHEMHEEKDSEKEQESHHHHNH